MKWKDKVFIEGLGKTVTWQKLKNYFDEDVKRPELYHRTATILLYIMKFFKGYNDYYLENQYIFGIGGGKKDRVIINVIGRERKTRARDEKIIEVYGCFDISVHTGTRIAIFDMPVRMRL